MPAKKQERLRQTTKELEDSTAYIDWKQNFYDEVLSGKHPYVSNLIRTENDWKKSAAVCYNKKITGKSQILFPVIFSMELVVRIELTTFSLRVRCSTIEPHQQRTFRILAHGGDKVKQKKL